MSIFQKISSNPVLKWSIALLACILLITIGIKNRPESIPTFNPYGIIHINFRLSKSIMLFLSLVLTYIIYQIILKIDLEHRYTEKSRFILALTFFLVLFSFPEILYHSNGFVVTLIIIISVKYLLKIHNQDSVLKLIFRASFLGSLASLIFFPVIIYLLVIFGSIAVFRPFNLKNYLLAIIAWSLPYFYLFSFSYLLDWNLDIPFKSVFNQSLLTMSNQRFALNTINYILNSGLVLLAIIALLANFSIKQNLILRKRIELSILFFSTILFAILSLLFGINSFLILSCSMGCIFIALYYHSFNKKWIIESIFIVLLLLSIGSHLFI